MLLELLVTSEILRAAGHCVESYFLASSVTFSDVPSIVQVTYLNREAVSRAYVREQKKRLDWSVTARAQFVSCGCF